MPVVALSPKANHIRGTNRAIGFSGIRDAKPMMRRSMATPPPARNAMPTLCSVTMVGNAQTQVEPRIQSLSALLSIQAKIGSTSHLLLFDAQKRSAPAKLTSPLGICEAALRQLIPANLTIVRPF